MVGSGCVSSVIAFLRKRPFAAAAALAYLGLAAERAAKALKGTPFGPVLFKARLIDELFLLTPESFAAGAKVEIIAL